MTIIYSGTNGPMLKYVKDWFGDRGYEPFEITNETMFKIVRVNNNSKWLFIENNEYDEIELYCLNSGCAECYDDFKSKGFDWSKKNLLSIVKEIE